MLDDKDLNEIEKRISRQCGRIEDSIVIFLMILFLQGCVHSCKGLPIREALSEIESGNRDNAIGRAKEVSRFQILPSVWREYSSLPRYRDENHAWLVAERILADRKETFRQWTKRKPNYREIYILWHRPTAFREAAYLEYAMPKRVRERANRFSNLCEERKGKL